MYTVMLVYDNFTKTDGVVAVFTCEWSFLTWWVAFLGAGGGLLVAATLKYADAILKTLATSGAIMLSTILGYFFLSGPLNMTITLGCTIVICAILNYTLDKSNIYIHIDRDNYSYYFYSGTVNSSGLDIENNINSYEDRKYARKWYEENDDYSPVFNFIIRGTLKLLMKLSIQLDKKQDQLHPQLYSVLSGILRRILPGSKSNHHEKHFSNQDEEKRGDNMEATYFEDDKLLFDQDIEQSTNLLHK